MVSQKFKKLLQRKSAGPKKKNALIICEGEKTELHYFVDLRKELCLMPSDVAVMPSPKGSAPISVAESAFEIARDKNGPKYNDIFCVFDKDTHPRYEEAIQKIRNTKFKNTTIHEITSVPCFEYWFLLHFEETTKPFDAKQLKSELRRNHIPGYEENMANIFTQTKHRLNTAITRAKRIEAECKKTETDNPSTKVHKLVAYLQNLSKTVNKF